ncbi:hypothetical protein BGZ72_008017 [Mortierella alpina]|nr:hypothetical protein BGZ72_008017 [Mortierella alpina]
MTNTRSPLSLTTQALLLLATVSYLNQVSAQFGLSAACNDCLVGQIGSLPSCVGVNLTGADARSNPRFSTCLCDASFDFGWTAPCGAKCQANELNTFQGNYANLLKTANIVCVKPTPSPSPSPTPAPQSAASDLKVAGVLGWTVLGSVLLCLVSGL